MRDSVLPVGRIFVSPHLENNLINLGILGTGQTGGKKNQA